MTTAQPALLSLPDRLAGLSPEPDPDSDPQSGLGADVVPAAVVDGGEGTAPDLAPGGDPASDGDSDAALVRALVAGSHEALSLLYDRHSSAVFSAAMRISREHGMAADVVQETFLALWNRAEAYDPARGALVAWLMTIARNRTVDHLRAAGRHGRAVSFSSFAQPEVDDASTGEWLTTTGNPIAMGEPDPGPDVALASRETASTVRAAIARLEPNERKVIELAYDAGLSQLEIAAQLGWPLGTVKTRTRRALRRLRDTMEHAEARGAPSAGPRPVAPSPCAWQPCA